MGFAAAQPILRSCSMHQNASFVTHQSADLLVANGIVITMDAERRILRGSVAVTGDRIAAIIPSGEPTPAARHTVDASRHIVIPGLVNAHDHLRNLTPGVRLAAGLKLDDYLRSSVVAAATYDARGLSAERVARLRAASSAAAAPRLSIMRIRIRARVSTARCWRHTGSPASAGITPAA